MQVNESPSVKSSADQQLYLGNVYQTQLYLLFNHQKTHHRA